MAILLFGARDSATPIRHAPRRSSERRQRVGSCPCLGYALERRSGPRPDPPRRKRKARGRPPVPSLHGNGQAHQDLGEPPRRMYLVGQPDRGVRLLDGVCVASIPFVGNLHSVASECLQSLFGSVHDSITRPPTWSRVVATPALPIRGTIEHRTPTGAPWRLADGRGPSSDAAIECSAWSRCADRLARRVPGCGVFYRRASVQLPTGSAHRPTNDPPTEPPPGHDAECDGETEDNADESNACRD